MHQARHRTRWVAALLLGLISTFLPPATPATAAASGVGPTVQVAAGSTFSYIQRADGTVWAWGQNCNGQLGAGSRADHPLPVRVPDLEGMTLAAGANHGLGLKADGTVWTWGVSCSTVFDPAQLSPRQIPGLVGAVAVAAGGDYSLAVLADGSVWAWGRDDLGQLGFSMPTYDSYRAAPAQIPGLSDVKAVVAGSASALALRNDGTVWWWGWDGQKAVAPTPVANLSQVVALAVGGAFYVLRADGTVWDWGSNYYGQLGDATTQSRQIPAQVPGLTGVTAITAGADFAAALKADGTVWAWGANSDGELGVQPGGYRTQPGQVPGLTEVVAIVAGGWHAVAALQDGTVRAWGSNYHGQLGDGTTTAHPAPVRVSIPDTTETEPPAWPADSQIVRVAFSADMLKLSWPAATDPSGIAGYRVYLGGQLADGVASDQLTYEGHGLSASRTYAIRVEAVDRFGNRSALSAAFRTVRQPLLAAGQNHSLLVLPDARVAAWGANDRGQLGLGFYSSAGLRIPAVVSGLTGVRALAGGPQHSVALTAGTVYTWGSNQYGQLGKDSLEPQTTPMLSLNEAATMAAAARNSTVLVTRSTGMYTSKRTVNSRINIFWEPSYTSGTVSVAGEDAHLLALHQDGTVWAWGSNDYGQLGDGTTTARSAPVQVAGLTDVQEIAAGTDFSLALKLDGTVWAWGNNSSGQLGADPAVFPSVSRPVQVPGLVNITSIAAGMRHGLAIAQTGSLFTWGDNSDGQLGDGTSTDRAVPAPVPGLANVVAAAGGLGHSLALTGDGSVWAWGDNKSGQLGDGTYERRLSPVRTLPPGSDTEPPAWAPGSAITVTSLDQNYLKLAWSPASDNGAVAGYKVYKNGTLSTVSVPEFWAALPVPGSRYHFEVQAYDAAGNLSPDKLSLTVDTPPPPSERLALAVAAGEGFTLTVRSDQSVWAWGSIPQSGVGDEVNGVRNTPVKVKGLSHITAVAAGRQHALALDTNGTVWAWGHNEAGELGDETTSLRYSPVPVAGLPPVQAIAAGSGFSLALDQDGRVWRWGANPGDSSHHTTVPTRVVGLSDVGAMAAGSDHALFLTETGGLLAMGGNQFGQVGDGSTRSQLQPVPVSGITDVKAIAAGRRHSLAVRSDGSVWAWGYNYFGQLGNGTTASQSRPVQVTGLTQAKSVGAGNDHSVALLADGTLWAWGSNANRQFGQPQSPSSPVPVQVKEVLNGAAIAAGAYHSVSLSAGGSLHLFGWNNEGELAGGLPNSETASTDLVLPAPDQTRPTWPWGSAKLEAQNVSERDLTLSWTPGQDNAAVSSYRIYRNGLLLDAVPSTVGTYWPPTYVLSGLDPGTPYLFQVVAADAEGNRSDQALQVIATTSGVDKTAPGVGIQRDGTPAILLGVKRGEQWSYITPVAFSSGSVTFRKFTGDQYKLIGVTSEPVTKVQVNGSQNGVTTDGLSFEAALSWPASGEPTFTLTPTDFQGNTRSISVQFQSSLTVVLDQAEAGHVVVGPGREVCLTGTASEELADLLVVDETNHRLPAVVTVDGFQFTAYVTLPDVGRDATYRLRVIGIGKDGWTSAQDPQGRDQRTVTVDVTPPSRPSLAQPKPVQGMLALTAQTVTLQGKAERGSTVTLVLNQGGHSLSAEVGTNGTFTFPDVTVPTEASTITLTAMDAAGNESEALSLPLVRDTGSPVLDNLFLLEAGAPGIRPSHPALPVDPSTTVFFVTHNSVTITGMASDAESGVKQVIVGTSVTASGSGDKSISFSAGIRLSESVLTVIPVTAVDLAGNKSETSTVRAILKTRIQRLTVSAKWSAPGQVLMITGTTDRAVLADGLPVGVVPLEIAIRDGQNQVVRTFTLDAENNDGYNFTQGTFAVTVGDLPDGTYTVAVKAKAPAEFRGLPSREASTTVTVRR